jgi:hypothetical protein
MSKIETLIATLQRLEIGLLGEIEDIPGKSLVDLERAINRLRTTMQLHPSAGGDELDPQLREQLRMQRAVEMLRSIKPAKGMEEAQPKQCFGFADLCEVAESASLWVSGLASGSGSMNT